MIQITNVTLKNFLSIGAVTQAMNLSNNGLTLIMGYNTDGHGSVTKNGAGKSSIVQAISFALFGKPLTNVKFDNLVNNINTKNMSVTIEFVVNSIKYKIERGRKPVFLRYFVNNVEQKLETDETQGENKQTQIEIERVIGMSHNLFKNIIALTTNTDPFLKMKVAEQRQIIEELLGITQLSHRADVLKKLIGTTKDSIKEQEAKIRATSEANDRITIAIRQAEARAEAWNISHKRKVDSLIVEIEKCIDVDYDKELENFELLETYDRQEAEIKSKINNTKREIALLEREANSLEQESKRYQLEVSKNIDSHINRLESDYNRKMKRHADCLLIKQKLILESEQMREKLDNADHSSCVTCAQSLKGTNHLHTVLAALNEQLNEILDQIAQEENEAAKLKEDAENIQKEINEIEMNFQISKEESEIKAQNKLQEAALIRDKIISQSDIVDDLHRAMLSLGTRPTVYFSTKDELYNSKYNQEKLIHELDVETNATNPHQTQSSELSKALQTVDYDSLNNLSVLLKHQEFLFKLLTNKDSFIRKKIIDQNLAYLNNRVDYYLDKLGLTQEVQFLSDLSVEITILGRDMDFEQLSRGEQNRVILATSWAFRDVWESMNTSCNLFFIDELLDNGLDPAGVEAALGVLKYFARDRGKDIFLISHREDLVSRIDRVITVKKENGFSVFELT